MDWQWPIGTIIDKPPIVIKHIIIRCKITTKIILSTGDFMKGQHEGKKNIFWIWSYGRLYEIILKAFEGVPSHMMVFSKCPKIEEFHFRFLFCFKIDHVLFIRNAPLFYVRNIWNIPISESNGAFQNLKFKYFE